MSKAKENKPSRGKKFIKFLLITFPIILLVLALVFYMSLRMAERYPDPLKEGMEQYMSDISGAYASIEKLNKYQFVPQRHMDFENITFHRRSNAAKIDLSVGKYKVVNPFWSSFLGLHKYKEMEILNVKSPGGIFLSQPYNFDYIKIIDRSGPEQFGSFLVATGEYNNQVLEFEAQLNKEDDLYSMREVTPFVLQLGQAILTGNIKRDFKSTSLIDTIFTINGKNSPSADYVLVKSGEYIKDNPLACLIIKGEGAECKKYLTDETNSE